MCTKLWPYACDILHVYLCRVLCKNQSACIAVLRALCNLSHFRSHFECAVQNSQCLDCSALSTAQIQSFQVTEPPQACLSLLIKPCGYALSHFAMQVCSESTGHAEAVQMTYNPEEVGYDKLVDLFYSRHNSTTPNRAGNDVGTQYRSGIYYHTDEQKLVSSC